MGCGGLGVVLYLGYERKLSLKQASVAEVVGQRFMGA